VGSSVRAAALAVTVGVVVALGAACSPSVTNRTSGADRAARAMAATRQLEQAEQRDLGCHNVVTSRERRSTPAPEHVVLLVDAYAVGEPCWDRIVFTFAATGSDMPPGYQIEYVEKDDAPRDCPIDSVGNAFLHITLTPASEYDTTAPGKPKQTYLGNLRLRLENMNHTQLVCKRPDGENTVSWMIGLDSKRPFTVDAASAPPRVIVYVMN
jgi:hypothetical protein